MPTAGRNTTSGNDTWVSNTGSNNQYGSRFTMSDTGLVQFLDVYMSGSGGTVRTVLCLWNSSGTLLAQTSQHTYGAGSGGVNGQSTRREALVTPVVISPGTYYVGFWRNGSDGAEWSYDAGSGLIHPSAPSGGVGNTGSPANLNTGSSTTGTMTAWIEYVVGGLGYYNGTAEHKYALKRWNGSAWQRHPIKKYSGSVWEWYA